MTESITIERERRIKICNWDAMAIDFSEECSHLQANSEPIPEFVLWKAPSANQRQPRLCIAHG